MTVEERIYEIIMRLVEARKNAGLSQTQTAKLLGCSPSSMSMYESGQRELDLSLFLRLCQAYDVSPVWALTGINPDFDPQAWYEKMRTARSAINEDLMKIAELLETIEYHGDRSE